MRKKLLEYICSGFRGIWVNSKEVYEARKEIQEVAASQDWGFVSWDIWNGARSDFECVKDHPLIGTKCSILNIIQEAPAIAAASQKPMTVIMLMNLHREGYSKSVEVMQLFQEYLLQYKGVEHGWVFVIVSPVTSIPIEWENAIITLDHPLPTKEDLWQIAVGVAQSRYGDTTLTEAELPELPQTPVEKSLLLEAAAGLTRIGAEDAFSLALTTCKRLDPSVVWALKADALKNRGLLTIRDTTENFKDLGGLKNYKKFSVEMLRQRFDNPELRPKGQLLLGVPGSGKSAAVGALGNELGRRVLTLDMGRMRSKFQGETDQNLRDALAAAEAMAPCILFIDEVEKALAGTESSGMTDGGTGARIFGSLLTWLNDHTSDVVVICTCNNIASLPPEFSRAERFDGIFFFDLPTAEEREAIWKIYFRRFNVSELLGSGEVSKASLARCVEFSEDWTGAEIRACCRLACMMHLPLDEAKSLIVPVIETAKERLEELREWASGRCLSASQPGRYTAAKRKKKVSGMGTVKSTGRRRLLDGESNN